MIKTSYMAVSNIPDILLKFEVCRENPFLIQNCKEIIRRYSKKIVDVMPEEEIINLALHLITTTLIKISLATDLNLNSKIDSLIGIGKLDGTYGIKFIYEGSMGGLQYMDTTVIKGEDIYEH